jgi:hypothetical protein
VDRAKAAYSSDQDEASTRRRAKELNRKTMSSFGQDNSY